MGDRTSAEGKEESINGNEPSDSRSRILSALSTPKVLVLAACIFGSLPVLSMFLPTRVFLTTVISSLVSVAVCLFALYARTHHWDSISLGGIVTSFLLVLLTPLLLIPPDSIALWGVTVLLIASLNFTFFNFLLFIPLALYDEYRENHAVATQPSYPTVSVLVPAYNEQGSIEKCIQALKEIEYPDTELEIAVIDDGSTDDTYEIASEQEDERVRVLRKENGGKAAALNYGLDHTDGEIVVTIDADSLVEKHAVKRLVEVFQTDRSVGALAGNIKVINRSKFITKLQAIEYIVGVNILRRALSVYGAVGVVPGALGGFRREALETVGGYDSDTLTEDFDITVKVLKAGYSVRGVNAVCRTEAPESWSDLYKQRIRWQRGTVMTLFKHRDVFVRSSEGPVPSLTFYTLLLSLTLVPLVGVLILGTLSYAIFISNSYAVIAMFGYFVLLQCSVSLLAIWMEDEDSRLAIYSPLFVIGYRQVTDTIILKSIIDVFVKKQLVWTTPTRRGTLEEYDD